MKRIAAQITSACTSFALKHVFKRPAANFPGKLALYIDPHIINLADTKLETGSFIVVGTNGKTTVTNLLAQTLERAGKRVICNTSGANLNSGIATSILQGKPAHWGVFECDELWLAHVTPDLQPTYVVLLNLFRDQLDRCGEIASIQESIIKALQASPKTCLIYNADDPFCAHIAKSVSNPILSFGIAEDLKLTQNLVPDASLCQECSSMLNYEYYQYGQLGLYTCPSCSFKRPVLDFKAQAIQRTEAALNFHISLHNEPLYSLSIPFTGTYMIYNILALASAASRAGVDMQVLQESISSFNPSNGRLQHFSIPAKQIISSSPEEAQKGAVKVLLNLAKNPTGFNQNIRLLPKEDIPCSIAFFVNDKEGDGRDVSWLWDIDFEELNSRKQLRVFAGGMRALDLAVRLKYAGLSPQLVANTREVLTQSSHLFHSSPEETSVFVIGNYTALPSLRNELTSLNSQPKTKE